MKTVRKIKFRAWDGEQMHEDVCPWQWDFVISRAWHRCEKSTGSGILGLGGDTGEFLVPGIRFTELMQFTGLKDKNGKEIYEGDIVRLIDRDDDAEHITTVNYKDGGFILEWDNAFHDGGDITLIGWANEYVEIEVIGNIYESKTETV